MSRSYNENERDQNLPTDNKDNNTVHIVEIKTNTETAELPLKI